MVVHANFKQFYPDERVRLPYVESRMLLWNKAGNGQVTVNDKTFDFHPDSLLIIPWKHSIHYHADPKAPFLLGGVHLIPRHAKNRRIQFRVVQESDDALANCPWRKNNPTPDSEKTHLVSLHRMPQMTHLLEYTANLFVANKQSPVNARRLGQMFGEELVRIDYNSSLEPTLYNPVIESLIRFIEDRLSERLDMSELIRQAHLSPASIERLFKKRLNITPIKYINQRRLEKAQTLLQTTTLSIAQVGESIGYPDAFHFSKAFKARYHLSPQKYRKSKNNSL